MSPVEQKSDQNGLTYTEAMEHIPSALLRCGALTSCNELDRAKPNARRRQLASGALWRWCQDIHAGGARNGPATELTYHIGAKKPGAEGDEVPLRSLQCALALKS